MKKLEAKDMKRGAIPSSNQELAAITPHVITPLNYIYCPSLLLFWGNNNQYFDSIINEELFAKACGNPEIFITNKTVDVWIEAHPNARTARAVLQTMENQGFVQDGTMFCDGSYSPVDYTNEQALRAAILVGPLKTVLAADQFGAVTPGENGWFLTNLNPDTNYNHCVSICGYGTMSWLAQQLGVSVPNGVNANRSGYAMFAWDSIGIIDAQSLISITGETFLRTPTTVVVKS